MITGKVAAFRKILIVVAAALLGFAVIRTGLTAFFRSSEPELALMFNPHDARAETRNAAQLVGPQATREHLLLAEALASESLRREPTRAEAARALAFAELQLGRNDRATKLIEYAGKLSRRDLATNLWLIEVAVTRRDVPAALQRYDAALRTSPAASDLLMPVMVHALDDPRLVQPFVDILARRPPWRDQFLYLLTTWGGSTANIEQVLLGLKKRGEQIRLNEQDQFIRRLIDLGDVARAWRVYTWAHPTAALSGLRNASFDRENENVPFEWSIASEPDIFGETTSGGSGSSSLRFQASPGVGGVVARQLLVLTPGTYRLSGMSATSPDIPQARPRWIASCNGTNGNSLAEFILPSGDDMTQFEFAIIVPAKDCYSQWLTLEARASDEPGGMSGQVSRLHLSRLNITLPNTAPTMVRSGH